MTTPHHEIILADDDTVRFNFPIHDDPRIIVPSPRPDLEHLPLFEILVQLVISELDDRTCYVEFSGGCDSSLVLSAATTACRRIGHADPVPVTYRFPELPETDETSYQEAMFEYLGLTNTIIRNITDEFDLVGDSAQRAMNDIGLMWPCQIMARYDQFRSLAPGLLLTGEGGDEVLGPRRLAEAVQVAALLRQRKYRRAGKVATRIPKQLRKVAFRKSTREDLGLEWLNLEDANELCDRVAQRVADEPLCPSKYPQYYWAGLQVRLSHQNTVGFIEHCGLGASHPLMHPTFLIAVAKQVSIRDHRHRTLVFRRHFGTHLPAEVLDRQTKANLTRVYFNEATHKFAETCLENNFPTLSGGKWLKNHWLGDTPNGMTTLPLQSASLANQGKKITQTAAAGFLDFGLSPKPHR